MRITLMRVLNKLAHMSGYMITKTGEDYIDPVITVKAAKQQNQSICEYLEGKEADQRKRGRRDRIIAAMAENGAFACPGSILEIGAGTGMYAEKAAALAKPITYEIYETHRGWAKFLRDLFSESTDSNFLVHAADGQTLDKTLDSSCQLVHAHAVFVYIPILNALSYISEAARVLKPGGYLVFDCLLASGFNIQSANAWLESSWRFPVLMPDELLFDFTSSKGLIQIARFREIYGPCRVDYIVLRKVGK